jgi:hypothetical protein
MNTDRFRHRTPPPAGFYVYAYIDPRTDEPFYIGKGTGRRAAMHLTPYQLKKHDSFFYRELRKMLDDGINAKVELIKDNLTEGEAYASEALLILLVGTRKLGTGKLCNTLAGDFRTVSGNTKGTPIYCWGTVFPSKASLVNDERCEVSYTQLNKRLKDGWSIFAAASTPPIRPAPSPWNRW